MDRVQWFVFSTTVGILLAAYLGLIIKQAGDTIAMALAGFAL